MQIMRIIKAIVTIAISADGYRGNCNFFRNPVQSPGVYMYITSEIYPETNNLDKEIII